MPLAYWVGTMLVSGIISPVPKSRTMREAPVRDADAATTTLVVIGCAFGVVNSGPPLVTAQLAGLLAAGVTRARTLATVLPNDAANVFITLSARSLNPELEIIARGDLPSTESKLLQAGANKVVLPTHIGAERIAEMILYEETARFIRGSDRMRDFEKVLHALGLNMDVVAAAPGSPAVGQSVEAVERESAGAFFVVQINRRDGEAITQPQPATRIEAGDGLVLIGRVLGNRSLFEPGGRSGFRRSAR